ncbi:MAG TPA: fused MFS/spermidine synthase [Gemmataceae bacterium]
MPLLFALTLFVSAALLFAVQPLVGRVLLPALGGSPVVWNTCLVFFQAVLLSGYLYAHLSARWLGARRQRYLHLPLLALPLAALPIASATAGPPAGAEAAPVGWLLGELAVLVGLPFFVVSATAPLLQRWFAATGHRAAGDPYFLYAASNLGSLLALLGYPFLAEPNLTLAAQSRAWAAGYLLLAGLIALCAAAVRGDTPAAAAGARGGEGAVTAGRRAGWVLLALVPSSLLLGVTTYLTTDLAAIPLLWVVPLALYLLTFVLAFGRVRVPPGWLGRMLAVAVIALAVAMLVRATEPLSVVVGLHLAAFFLAAWFCHALLARDRPDPAHLTEFYLWMSVGGVLGGLFNVLAAPLLFRHLGLVEYPLALIAACLFREKVAPAGAWRWGDVAWPVAAGLAVVGLIYASQSGAAASWLKAGADWLRIPDAVFRSGLVFGIPAVLVYTFVDRPRRFGLGLAALFLAGTFDAGPEGRTVFLERNSLGVVRVTTDADGHFLRMVHGNTIHGQQRRGWRPETVASFATPLAATGAADAAAYLAAGRWAWVDPHEPLTYYHRTGPIGDVFRRLVSGRPEPLRVGAVGLGTGSVAWYAEPGQEWTFFELDPTVIRLAQDPNYFTYLRDCKAAELRVVPGDARLRLAEEPDASFDLLVLDAFSSDAIPMHLLTAEALGLYRAKLKPGGVLAFHVSNRYLDLPPILGRLAGTADPPWAARVAEDLFVSDRLRERGKYPSVWVVMAEREEDLEALRRSLLWRPVKVPPGTPRWTDDFANLFSALRRGDD